VLSIVNVTKFASGLLFAALTAACATPAPPVQTESTRLPDPGPDQEYKVEFPDLGHGMARYIVLTLGDDLAGTCGAIHAHFDFDSDAPLPQDRLVLKSAAECLNRPELKGHDILVVGRTDDRGTAEYNQALGLRRADRVKQALVDAGVAASRIRTTSSGKSQAKGGDERRFSYGYDRRVEIGLLGMTHAPRRGAP